MCSDVNEKENFIKDLHVKVKNQIERMVEKFARHGNKGKEKGNLPTYKLGLGSLGKI